MKRTFECLDEVPVYGASKKRKIDLPDANSKAIGEYSCPTVSESLLLEKCLEALFIRLKHEQYAISSINMEGVHPFDRLTTKEKILSLSRIIKSLVTSEVQPPRDVMDDAAVYSVYKEIERMVSEEITDATVSGPAGKDSTATLSYIPSPALMRRLVLNAVQSVTASREYNTSGDNLNETSSDIGQWGSLIASLAHHHFNYFDSKKRVFDQPSAQLPAEPLAARDVISCDAQQIEHVLASELTRPRAEVRAYAQYQLPPQCHDTSRFCSLNTQDTHVTESSSVLEALPTELQYTILGYLTPTELYLARAVNRRFQVTCVAPALWTTLDLSFVHHKYTVTDELLSRLLMRHRGIRRLVLRGVNEVLTGQCFLTLAAHRVTLRNLRELVCHHYTALQGGLLFRGLAQTCPNLRELDLDGSCSLNDDHLQLLCTSAPQLTSLALRAQSDNLLTVLTIMQRHFSSRVPRNITLTGVKQMISLGILQLRHLRLKLTEISGELFANLAKSMPHLESLTVSQDLAFKVNDKYLHTLSATDAQWPDLKRLSLEGDIFTDQFLASLLPLAPQLQRLTLLDCNITDRALEVIAQQLPKLGQLSITGVHPTFITERGLTFLLSNCPLHSVQISAALSTCHFITSTERHNRWRQLIATDVDEGDTVTGVTALHKIISNYSEDQLRLPIDGGAKIRINSDLLMSPKPHLQHVMLNHVEITDQALVALLRHAPQLRTLSLISAVIKSTTSQLDLTAAALESLALVDVALADHVLVRLLSGVPQLRSLCLYHLDCPVLAPLSFVAPGSWPHVSRVILGRWQSLDDTLLSTLLSRTQRIECLELLDLLVPLSLTALHQALLAHHDSFRALVLNHCSALDQRIVRSRFDPNLVVTFM